MSERRPASRHAVQRWLPDSALTSYTTETQLRTISMIRTRTSLCFPIQNWLLKTHTITGNNPNQNKRINEKDRRFSPIKYDSINCDGNTVSHKKHPGWMSPRQATCDILTYPAMGDNGFFLPLTSPFNFPVPGSRTLDGCTGSP